MHTRQGRPVVLIGVDGSPSMGVHVTLSDPACGGNTKFVQQLVIGFWDKAYSGDFGSFRVGVEYTYEKRESFSGEIDAKPLSFGPVSGDDSMIYTSIRYYPFQK